MIYFAGDSGREGQYIEELVIMMCGPKIRKKTQKRVWIDSTTQEEIKRGIRDAKDMSAYACLGKAGFLRAKEDYLMGINFSRLVTLKYGDAVKRSLGMDKLVIAVGRVMSCVLAMAVNREEEIKNFKEDYFYKICGQCSGLDFEWKAVEGSGYYNSPLLYKENGFKTREDAEKLLATLPREGLVEEAAVKKEKKYAPLLYNLAELQNDCSKQLKISPDETLTAAQKLYEAKMTTYPRTDARVLSSAVADVVDHNLRGLAAVPGMGKTITLALGQCAGIKKSKYVDDSKITDHYAIIPTGDGVENKASLTEREASVYWMVVKRFLAIFLPPAEYEKMNVTVKTGHERFFHSSRTLVFPGYLALYGKKAERSAGLPLKKGDTAVFGTMEIKEGKTSPPPRYTTGSMILAMENAGQLIEDEALREQIRGSGIGTSATRAATLTKLEKIGYLKVNKKTQAITPTKLGYAVYIVLSLSIPQMLSPKLTANWELGLSRVEQGAVTEDEYTQKMNGFVRNKTEQVKAVDNVSLAAQYIRKL
ncbi:MAG: DNA topoisomerase [Clostridiales bacterium]|nr:DNA topoisomerase [Clostridiales bacterium]